VVGRRVAARADAIGEPSLPDGRGSRGVQNVVARGEVEGGWALAGARRGTNPKLSGRVRAGTDFSPTKVDKLPPISYHYSG